jgi:hypothetical protein
MAEEKVSQATFLAPGSGAAIAAGCQCPILDNAHGAGYLGLGMYIIAEGCPIHPLAGAEEGNDE